jgi:putative aldouronate transport system permease protein
MKRIKAGRLIFNGINALIMALICAITLYPFLFILAASLSSPIFIAQGKVGIIPIGFNTTAYRMVFEYPMIGRAYLNTIYYTTFGTALNIILTLFAAYPLSRKTFLGRKFFNLMVFIPIIFTSGIIPSFLVVNGLGLRNTVWAMVLPGAIMSFNVILMRSFLEQIPSALEEAARIDGATHSVILFKVILPLSLPSIATIGLFYAVGHWNSFFGALLYLRDPEMHPIQIVLRNIVIMNQTETVMQSVESDRAQVGEAIKYATIMVATLPILAAYPFIQKYFVKGVMLGSIKG